MLGDSVTAMKADADRAKIAFAAAQERIRGLEVMVGFLRAQLELEQQRGAEPLKDLQLGKEE